MPRLIGVALWPHTWDSDSLIPTSPSKLPALLLMDSGPSSNTDAPPRSLDRQLILEEDEYTEALSHIIARDFFPSLVHLDATNDYLDALKSQDPTRIQETVRRMEEINTPVAKRRSGVVVGATPTPYGGRGTYDTPLRTPYSFDQYGAGDGEGSEPLSKRRKFDTDMSLDNFQAKYTSEDNASFLDILNDENKKRKETYGWAYNAQKRVEEQRERMLEGRERLLIEPPQVAATGVREKFRIEAPKPVGLITQGEVVEGERGKGKEVAVVSGTKDDEVVDVMAPKKDAREAGVDGWKFKVSSSVKITDSHALRIFRREMLLCLLRMQTYHRTRGRTFLERLLTPRVSNTGARGYLSKKNPRLPVFQSLPALPEVGSMRRLLEYHVCDLEFLSFFAPAHGACVTDKPSSPKNNGFGLVPTMPSPTPEELGPAAVKQLMTWGTLDATPRIISSDDPADVPEPSTPFRIANPSSRERISHKLSANASKSLRAKAILLGGSRTSGTSRTPSERTRGNMGPPTWTPKRADVVGNLTPAAKKLLNRTMASRRSEAMERASNWQGDSSAKEKDLSKIRWTPTPGR